MTLSSETIEPFVNINNLTDDAKCYRTVRNLRWGEGKVQCVCCSSEKVIRHGHHNSEPERQRYLCRKCGKYFDDLTGTVFEGHHRPLRIWILCLYFMGLNLSNRQIAKESELNRHPAKLTLYSGFLNKASFSEYIPLSSIFHISFFSFHIYRPCHDICFYAVIFPPVPVCI